MSNVTFYAATMSQWSVIRPIVERNSRRYRRTFILSADVQAKTGLIDPVAVDYGSASSKPSDDEFFLKMTRGPRAKASWLDALIRRDSRVTEFNERVKTRAKDKRISASSYLAFVSAFKKTLSYYTATLLDLKTDVLVVGEDGISGELWLIGAAKRLGIPVVILPYEASGKEDFVNLVEQKKRESSLIVPTEEQIALLSEVRCPDWGMPYGGSHVLIYPVEYIIALADCDIRPLNPWTTHGGEADFLMAESKGMHLYYLDEGLPIEKVPVVGSSYADRVAHQIDGRPELGGAFRAGHKVDATQTRILVSLPPSYHDSRAHLCPYATYEEMIRDVAQTVTADPRAKATFVVHPALYQQQSSILRSIGDVTLSQEWVIDLIPQHDIFISCGSSTLRWSVAARKPTINVDYYKFRLQFFDRLEGLSSFEEPDDFSRFFGRLVDNDGFYREITSKQAAVGEKWGVLDGQNIDRIEDFLLAVRPRAA